MFNAMRNHKNHIGPVGVIGSAFHCDQNAGQSGSAAVRR